MGLGKGTRGSPPKCVCYFSRTTFRLFEMGASRPFFVKGMIRPMATIQVEKERQLQREVTGLVQSALPGTEVLALELTGRERFCVFVDHPGGVDHALCERVTAVLRRYLDEYSVEVSSPGPKRPLRSPDHFTRAVGRTVSVKTPTAKIRGVVVEAGDRAVQIESGSEPLDIPYSEIVRANLIDEG